MTYPPPWRVVARLVRDARRSRSQSTLLGRYWALLLPLVESGAFTLVFGVLLGLGGQAGGASYLAFTYVGVLAWRVFARGLGAGTRALSASGPLLLTTAVPAWIPVVAAVGAALVDGLVAVPVLLVVSATLSGIPDPLALLPWLAMGATLHLAVTVGAALALATAHAFYGDVGLALGPALGLLMFASPVVYPLSVAPETLRPWLLLNPMSAAMECFRAGLLGGPAPGALPLAGAATVSALVLLGGAAAVQRADPRLREVL